MQKPKILFIFRKFKSNKFMAFVLYHHEKEQNVMCSYLNNNFGKMILSLLTKPSINQMKATY